MDLEDADAFAVRIKHADDAVARHGAAFLERDGHVVLDAADGHTCASPLAFAPLLPASGT